MFRKLAQEAADGNDENEDIAKGLARVFAEVGEAYVDLISAGKAPTRMKLPVSTTQEQYASFAAGLLRHWHALACIADGGWASGQASISRDHTFSGRAKSNPSNTEVSVIPASMQPRVSTPDELPIVSAASAGAICKPFKGCPDRGVRLLCAQGLLQHS